MCAPLFLTILSISVLNIIISIDSNLIKNLYHHVNKVFKIRKNYFNYYAIYFKLKNKFIHQFEVVSPRAHSFWWKSEEKRTELAVNKNQPI